MEVVDQEYENGENSLRESIRMCVMVVWMTKRQRRTWLQKGSFFVD